MLRDVKVLVIYIFFSALMTNVFDITFCSAPTIFNQSTVGVCCS